MDWKQVIERNREALAVVVAGLIAMMGRRDTLPRHLRHSIYRILRPAESALRRLIVIVAATLQGKARKDKAVTRPLPDFSSFGQSTARPAFRLIDPRKRFAESAQRIGPQLGIPRISVPGFIDAVRPEKPRDTFNAAALCGRVESLNSALKTLPQQARRLNRLMQRRAKAEPGPGRVGPIRPGHPPGFRKRASEPVDDILRDCHFLALDCGLKPP